MIGIAGLPPGVVTAADFVFKVGMSGDPATWATAPAPAGVSVRRLYGLAGTDRIEITWSDNAIRNEWLQVTVKANARTGLRSDEVFYFGNLAGDATGDGSVGFADLLALAQQYGHAPTPAASADFNADGTENFADLLVLALAYGQGLPLISAPQAAFEAANVASTAAAPSVREIPGSKKAHKVLLTR